MHCESSVPYDWKVSVPSRACIIRPRIGIALDSAWLSSPTCCRACRPRTLMARLMLRPARMRSLRRSARRSTTSTS